MKILVCALLCLLPIVGCADEQVRRVQEELRKRNLFYGEIDGKKTSEFSGALRKYQERKGFAASGNLDDTTLRSLDLLPALPVSASNYWPEMSVLKSDSARVEKTAATPPPIAETATLPEDFGVEQARAFIKGYLKACESNDLQAELNYYADPLDYFDQGIVDLRFVQRDVRSYYKKWPQRKYELVDFSAAPSETRPGEAVAKFRIKFSVKNDQHNLSGATENVFTMKADGAKYRIVSMRESRIRTE